MELMQVLSWSSRRATALVSFRKVSPSSLFCSTWIDWNIRMFSDRDWFAAGTVLASAPDTFPRISPSRMDSSSGSKNSSSSSRLSRASSVARRRRRRLPCLELRQLQDWVWNGGKRGQINCAKVNCLAYLNLKAETAQGETRKFSSDEPSDKFLLGSQMHPAKNPTKLFLSQLFALVLSDRWIEWSSMFNATAAGRVHEFSISRLGYI